MIRELKAVGGDLRALRLALTGRDRGPELWAVLRALPRDEALRRAAAALLEAMRLYDTYSRSLVELPPPPGPVRMYFCGPTVYARAHVGNARPFLVGMWLRSWLRATGYEAVLVHNITDVNDKIYDAAPGASAELAERATRWYLEDTGDLGLGLPDHLPKATESIPAIVAFIEELVDRGFAYPVQGDVYFRVSRFPEYGRLSGQRPDQVEEQEPNPLKEDGRDFALWKANKPGHRGHVVGVAVGPRPARLAHRVLGDGRAGVRAGVRDPRRRPRPRLPASRERGGAVAGARPSVRADLGPQRHAPLHRREDVEVARQRRDAARGARPVGARGAARVLPRRALAEAGRLLGRHARRRRRRAWRRCGTRSRSPRRRPTRRAGQALAAALDDDFDTPRALAVLHEWASEGQLELLERGLALFGLGSLAVRERGAARGRGARRARAQRRAQERDFATSDGLRDELAALGWEMRDEPGGGYVLVRREP